MWETGNNDHQYYGLGINPFMLRYQVDGTSSNHIFYAGTSATTSNELMRITGTGNVGIGTTAPDAKCHVEGALGVYSTTNDIMGLFSPNYGSYLHIGSWNRQGNTSKNIVMNLYGGYVGIGITNPQATLHVQGGTLVTNPTVYNTAVGGWFIIGYWDCAGAQNAGAHLKLRIMGCNGYDNTTDTNQMGGETTIYLNNLNNLNTTTNANVDGFWKHEGGRIPITQVKAVQGGSRYQYYIYASVQSYTQHSITAETTQGTIWTSQMTSTSDPGANSLTVRVLTLSTAAVGATVGIGATAPDSGISAAIPNAKLTILGGSPGLENGVARISIGGDSYHYAAIEGKHIGSGSTTLSFMTCVDYSANSGNPQTRIFIANDGKVGIGTITPNATLQVNGSLAKSSGTFDIGHPLYPDTNKRLVHSFIEGPRCDLIYRGKTTLVDGSAIVNIDKECTHSPECAMDEGTFEALCDNPQIFLQNNQSFDRVRGVISGATLTITCENPASVVIEWMVIAERADPFIKQWDRTNPNGYLVTQYTAEDNTTVEPSN
jgi:hypothetical protein